MEERPYDDVALALNRLSSLTSPDRTSSVQPATAVLRGKQWKKGYRLVSFLNLFVLNFIPINSYIIRLALLAKTPVFFDDTLNVVEDWHYLLQLIQNGFRFEAIAVIRHRSWGQKVGSAVKRWFGIS